MKKKSEQIYSKRTNQLKSIETWAAMVVNKQKKKSKISQSILLNS